MNPLVYHIVSGQAFFSGAFCIVLAVWLSTRVRLRRFRTVVFVVGLLLVMLSSTPLPAVLYVAIGLSTLLWFASRWIERLRPGSSILVVTLWAVAVTYELTFFMVPSITTDSRNATILVVADSVTAGLGDDPDERTWPTLLMSEHQIAINDKSHVGETAGSALKRIESRFHTGTAIVEIGGNDLLGSTSPAKFGRDLNALIGELHSRKATREIIMFELPLPPFAHSYGYAQRRVAARYGVKLIPKRVLLSVLAGEQSTLDSIHLSQAGHRRMADVVLALLDADGSR